MRPTGQARAPIGDRQVSGRAKFEAALRQNEPPLAAASVTIPSGAAARAVAITGKPEVPALDPDREVVWKVDGSAVRFDLAELLAKPAVAGGTALNSMNAVVRAVGGKLCMLARSTDSASQFLFSSAQTGTCSVAIAVSSIDLEPWARRSNPAKIPAARLPAAQGLTQAQVDARVRALAVRGDPLVASSFTGVNLTSGADGKVGASGLTIRFTSRGTAFTVNRIEQVQDDHDVSVFLTPTGQSEKLAGLKIMINDLLLSWDEAPDNGGGEYRWPAQAATTVIVGANNVTVYEPWDEGNLVPGGAPADDGKVLKKTAEGPAWGTVAYSDLTGHPHGGGGVIELVDGPITGITIPDATLSVPSRPGLTLATPAVDLDDYQHGEFHVSITLTVTERSVNTLGFGDSADATYRLTDIIFASTLRGLSTFDPGGNIEGERVGNDVDVYNGNVRQGTLQVYLGRNGENRVGYLMRYEGIGTAAASLTVGATMQLSFGCESQTDESGGPPAG